MNSLKSMKDALRPLGLYNLGEDSFISRELSCYAQFLDEVGEAIDSLLTEGFLQTAGEEGIARMEALAGARQPEEMELEKRREMLLYRFAHRPDDFNRDAPGAGGSGPHRPDHRKFRGGAAHPQR